MQNSAAKPSPAAMAKMIRNAVAVCAACTIVGSFTGDPLSHHKSTADARTPTTAPALSIARWSPNARPRSWALVVSAISASRGLERIPLPTRSTVRPISTIGQATAATRMAFPSTGRPYPHRMKGTRRRNRSLRHPAHAVNPATAACATPSTQPSDVADA